MSSNRLTKMGTVETAQEDTEVSTSLIKRVYYAARDGMAIVLYGLLSDKPPGHIDYLINQVNISIYFIDIMPINVYKIYYKNSDTYSIFLLMKQ